MNKSTLALLLALVTAPALLAQNLIVNGSFEIDAPTAPSYNNNGGVNPFSDPDVGPTGSFITGWTAAIPDGHTVTFFAADGGGGGRPTPVDGSYIYNVGGFARERGFGTIFQDFSTSIGQQYHLSYFIAGQFGETDNAMAFTQVYDIVSGSTNGPALNSQSASTNSNTFQYYDFLFTAIGTTSRLMFTDAQVLSGLSGTDQQLNIDAVSVTAIPEPSTYAAMAGAAMLGLAVWRRRRVAAPVAA